MTKLTLVIMILLTLTVIHIKASEAQRTSPLNTKPNLNLDHQGECWESSSFALTEAQKKALQSLRSAYMVEAIPLRTGLVALMIELRHSLRDPNVQPQTLFDRQRKISELRAKLEELSMSYLVKARSIFTKDQLERLPQEWAFDMGLEYEIPFMDMGRRSKKRFQ